MSTNGSRAGSSATEASLDALSRRNVETAVALTSSMLKGWETIGEAWLGFTRSQVESNLALMQSLAKCDNPLSALTLQIDGAQATLSRCMEMMSRDAVSR